MAEPEAPSEPPPPLEGGEAWAPPSVSDFLTILYDASDRPLTKSYAFRGCQILKKAYPQAAEFRAREIRVAGIEELARALNEVAQEGRGALIRGAPGRFHPSNGSPAFRLAAMQEGLAYAGSGKRVPAEQIRRSNLIADGSRLLQVVWLPTFEERPRRWLILDVDRVPVPPHLGEDWPFEPETVVEHVLGLLPEPFAEASCWWQLSSSAMTPACGSTPAATSDTVRIKLGFWLSRPLGSRDAKLWMLAEQAPVDPAVLQTIQLTYIAHPIFAGGLIDPLPRRIGFRAGLDSVVQVPDPLPRPIQADDALDTPIAAEDLDELAGLLRERLASSPHVREHLSQAVHAYLRRQGTAVDQKVLVRTLEKVALEHRSRAEVEAYGLDRLVAHHAARQRLRVIQGPAPHYPGDELDAAEALKQLQELIETAVAAALEHDAGGNEPVPETGIKAAAGLGKTRTLLSALQRHPGRNIEIYVPTVRLAEEIAEETQRRGLDVQVIRGREAVVDSEPLCRKHEEAAIVARLGLSVTTSLCRRKLGNGTVQTCPFHEGCRYFAQFENPEPRIRILAHAYLTLRRPPGLPKPDLVVIDEAFALAMARETSFGTDRLTATRGPGMQPEDEALVHDLGRRLRTALEQGEDPRRIADRNTLERAAGIEAGDLDQPVWPTMRWEEQKRRLAKLQKSETFKLCQLWRILAEEADRTAPLQRVILQRDAPSSDGERQDRIRLYWRATWSLPSVPVIVLDASLDETLARKFLPRLKVQMVPAIRRAEVVQVVDTVCSRNRLLSYETADDDDRARADRRLDEVRMVAHQEVHKGGAVALVTYKPAEERLGTIEGVDILHFGALRGLDRLKNHDVLIVAGREQPSPADIEGLARALFGDDDTPLSLTGGYVEVGRGYRMRDGTRQGCKIQVHPDPRCQAILEQIREREIEQAIDRLRLVHRASPGRVILMTNIVVDVTVDRLTSWRDLIPSRWQRTGDALRGCLPLSPSELARLLPEVWGTAEAAKAWLRRHPEKGVQTLIGISIGKCPPFFSKATTLVEYRRPGQRGSPHWAWLPGDIFCAEAAAGDLVDAGFGQVLVERIVEVARLPTETPHPVPMPHDFRVDLAVWGLVPDVIVPPLDTVLGLPDGRLLIPPLERPLKRAAA